MFIPSPIAAAAGAEDFRYTLNAEDNGSGIIGYSGGLITTVFGELLPDNEYQIYTIDQVFILASGNLVMRFPQINVPNDDSVFNHITLSGEFVSGPGTLVLSRIDAGYSNPGTNQTGWTWQVDDVNEFMIDGNTYRFTISTEIAGEAGDYEGAFSPRSLLGLVHEMTAGQRSGDVGYGGGTQFYGTLVPDRMANGFQIIRVNNSGSESSFTITLQFPNIPNIDDTFVSISITGIFSTGVQVRTITYQRNVADYSPNADGGATSRWVWVTNLVEDGIIFRNDYEVVFEYLDGVDGLGYSDGVGDISLGEQFGLIDPKGWNHPTLGSLEITRLFNSNNEFLLGFNRLGNTDLPDDDSTWSEIRITGPFAFEYIASRTVGFRSSPLGSFYGWRLPEAIGLDGLFDYDVEIIVGGGPPADGPLFLDNFVEAIDTPLENHTPDVGGSWVNWFGNAVDHYVIGGAGAISKLTSDAVGSLCLPAETSENVYIEFDAVAGISGSLAQTQVYIKHDGNSQQTFAAYRLRIADGTLRIDRMEDGDSIDTIGSISVPGFNVNDIFKYRMEATVNPGNVSFDLFVNGDFQGTFADATAERITAPGQACLGMFQAGINQITRQSYFEYGNL